MTVQEILAALRREPFEPFRLRLTDGQSYQIRHCEFATVSRTSVYVGLPPTTEDAPDRVVRCDLVHVVSLEPANGRPGRPKKARKR